MRTQQKNHIMHLRNTMAYCLFCFFGAIMLATPRLNAADLDNDGLDDAWETANGYNTSLYTRIVHVDAVNGDDATGDGLSASTALKSIGAALALNFTAGDENVILAAPGTYTGAANRELDFNGKDIWLRASGGASQTIIDLEGTGRFLSLTHGETLASRLDGFTIRNGYKASCGTAVHLSGASLTILDCVFEDNRSGRKVEYDYGEWIETWWEDADSTAAVFAEDAPVRITGTVFRRNASTETMYGGMWMDNAGALLLANADGTVVEVCSFLGNSGQGAGAVALYGTDATFRRCRFQRNVSLYEGGAVAAAELWDWHEDTPDGCDITMENCLLLGNKAFGDYSDIRLGPSCTATLKHVTVSGGTARNGHGLRFGGDADAFNSILDAPVSLGDGISFTADHCCSRDSLTAYGNGNFRGSPALTGAGFLTSASICRGDGGSAGLLATDIAGNTRNASSIDLGCRAFADTDADGIPDDVETAAGLNPANDADASGDRDGDGILNLREYELGTGIATADSDGDGIADAAELSQGYDPAWPTRIIHVSASGDDNDDGLTPQTPKAGLASAVDASRGCGWDNVILLAPGTYSGEDFRGLDFGGYDIAVRGAGPSATIIDLGGAGRLLSASGCETPASRLEGLTIRNGSADYGSAVSVSRASLSIRGCVIENCSASQRGALCVSDSGRLVVDGCSFRGNTADRGAAISVRSSATLILSATEMRGNRSSSYGGALHVDGASAEVSASRLLFNHAGGAGGGIMLSGTSVLEMANSLLLGNEAAGGSSGFHCDSPSQRVSLANCTIAEGSAAGGLSCSLDGQISLLNSIFTGDVSFNGNLPSASFNCAPSDWSGYGSGNIQSNPLLTSAGMLTSGSPCIDAGDGAFAPYADIDGTARPSGNGVDIGCHEFLDSDSDGLPDFLEGSSDILPGGDEDNDGLTNIQEYLLGTDILNADTDGDGIGDAAEAALDYNPLLPTRIVHVNPATGDDANSGLSATAAKRTLSAAVSAARRTGCENVVLAAPGTYSGASNRGLDFNGYDIKLVSTAGAAQTIIDLEQAGRLLSLTRHETLDSRIEGLTIRNGYTESYGIAVHLENASLDIRDCVFENNNSGRKATYDYGDGYVETWWEDASSTAAVYASGAPVRITGTVFRNNTSHETMWGGMDADNAGAVLLCNSEGSVIDNCDFVANRGYGAGAIAVSGATLDVSRSRFLRNFSYANGGAISASAGWYYYYEEDMPETAVSLTNCLLLGNKATQDFSDLNFGDGCTAFILNATIADGFSRDGHSSRFGGDTDVVNSIINGTTVRSGEILFTAQNNCTSENWSSYGTGNIASDPMLTGMGMLKAGSPCIDAGTSSCAPAFDLFGNLRPAGNGIDIGCHEFLDTDGDGIPDFIETASGLDTHDSGDASSDLDGDGLSNLQEYLLGTGVSLSDTDGDGIADGVEVQRGDNPRRPTNIVYVSPLGDDTASGRTASTAKATFAAALELLRECGSENMVIASAGTYTGAGNRSLDFEGFDVSIRGASGASPTVVDLENVGRFLSLTRCESPETRIENLTFRNGSADCGSVIYARQSSPAIMGCAFESNTASYGGAIYVERRRGMSIDGCVFDGNMGQYGAAIYVGDGGGVSVRDSRLHGNLATGRGGAVRLYGGSAEFIRTRFTFNLSRGDGGVAQMEGSASAASFADCLFMGNRSLAAASAIHGNNAGQSCSIVNCTFMDGGSANGLACCFEGNASIRNTILTEGIGYSGERPPTVAYSAVPSAELAALGTGNIAAAPMLTGAGMLKAGSPCIDSGTNTGASANDLFGNIRPAGNAVDIGCHEFLDTDGDGIPDLLEGNGVLPEGDEDNDGLTNLQEYIHGTGIFTADTDGDGVSDADELAQSRDPLRTARTIHVSPSGGDSRDGLSPATAKRTLASAVPAARTAGWENIVLVAPGTYAGDGNRGLDFDGFDIRIVSSGGHGAATIDLAGGSGFLALRHGETYRSRLDGLAFVRSREATPAITLDGADLTVSGCSFRGFARTGDPDDYMFYDYDFSTACVMRLASASCRLERVEVAYCSYSPDCPLFSGTDSELCADRCRIVGNETGCGPLVRFRDTELRMVNTMVAKNNVASTGGIALVHGDSLVKAVNCTFAANAPAAASAISGEGAVEMLNTVFDGLVSGCGVSLSHCMVAPAYADASTGCISGGAGLAGGLFLTPESPCIDAGATEGAPAVDFAGTPRPQGAGVDIGCEEYRDSNGDGISDFYSAWCSGNLSANGDLDGDGLSDLQEMLLGTDAANSDTDGDGMPDGWEASRGLDPLHGDGDGDPDGDRLVSYDEFVMGTDPMNPDTDGDGRNDGWEAHTAFSDPTVADFNGSSSSVVSLTGNLFTDSGGGWEADGSGARARGRSGWLQYSVQVPFDGVYLLELGVSEAGTASAGAFTVSCRVDGASCGSLIRIPLDAMQKGTGVCMTPFLRAGLHSVRIDWDNVYRNTSLRVDSIRLLALDGPDADGDGVPDWAETRLANMSCTALPQRSRVSPVCVEGGNASYIEAIAVSGYYVAPGGDDPHPPVRRIAGNRWYADLPLDPNGATPVSVTVSYQNSAVTVSGNVLWEPVDVASLDEDTVRLDDEMRLTAELPEGVQAWTLAIGGVSRQMARGEVFRHRFATAGDVAVTASWLEAGGAEASNSAVVHVLAAGFGCEPVCHAGTERTWRIAGIGDDIHVEIDREVQSTDLGCSNGARQFLLRGTTPAIAYATARVREGGPVLDTTAVHVIETATHVGDGYHRVIADFGDGTVLYDGYVVAGQVVEGMSVTVTLWGTNSTFEDGTQEKTFTWQSFDAAGELHFSILGGRSFTTCMTVILYQDGEEVWRLQ